jgi:transcriptional regulator with XRE-family HTH domain
MPVRAQSATPNVALYNLRDARGESQQDVASAINDLAVGRGDKGKGVCVTANQVSRWERGITRPSPLFRQLLAEHFGVTVEDLGLVRPKQGSAAVAEAPSGDLLDLVDTATQLDEVTAESQRAWRAVRQSLDGHRVELAHAVAQLYGGEYYLPDTGMLAHPDWLPATPVPLRSVRLELDGQSPAAIVVGTDKASEHVRPLASISRRFHRYSQAIRVLSAPQLFENRMLWSLLDVAWFASGGQMTFGDSTYFAQVDVSEALAHETAQAWLGSDRAGAPTWRGLGLRRHIGDPFDLSRRALGTSTDTLTIRQDSDGATFVLHNRDSGSVAVAGGMLHVMPCGVFQPSSIHPAAMRADFDLWRNIMREYSEEFLGNPEHDGDGVPIDYAVPPFSDLDEALADGRLRVYSLGVGLDALTLFGELLTVAVFDADLYDSVFGEMVDRNDEGSVVKTGRAHPTSALPFTEHMVRELLDGKRLAPAGGGCLRLAWEHRRTILG